MILASLKESRPNLEPSPSNPIREREGFFFFAYKPRCLLLSAIFRYTTDMNPEDISFEEFFAERTKQKGLTVKKLADITGISPRHMTEIARGDFAALPSAPYVRGYLLRLGQALDFDGEAWWQKIKSERQIKNSGVTDSLPINRFIKKAPVGWLLGGAVVLILVIYLAFEFPKIIGRPSLTLVNPSQNPFTTEINPITLQGSTENANGVSVNGETVPLNPDGTWQKDVLLSSGPNQIVITAQKFLGRTTSLTEEIIYNAPAGANGNSAATSTAASTTSADSAGGAPSSSLTQ